MIIEGREQPIEKPHQIPFLARLVTKLTAITGPHLLLYTGDPAMIDRWKWTQRHLGAGALRTLDAGSGSGGFALSLAARGNRVVGLNLDERQNVKARARAEMLHLSQQCFIITTDLGELSTLSDDLGRFDQILCLETIEHIIEDQKLIHDLASMLAPGGKLLLTSPNLEYNPLPGDTISQVQDGGHVRWGYTHSQIVELLHNAGLTIVEESYVTGIVSQALIRGQRHLTRFLPPYVAWALMFPGRLLIPLDHHITSALRYPYMCVAVAARKE